MIICRLETWKIGILSNVRETPKCVDNISEPVIDKCMTFGKCTFLAVLFNICIDCIVSVLKFGWT